MSIAVVDPNGDLISFVRMDDASYRFASVARTSARFRRPTQAFYNAYETGHPYVATLDAGLVASPGGVSIRGKRQINRWDRV